MPSTQSKRDLILKSSVTAATVADLNISMEALFDTDLSTVITYEDESDPATARDEKTKYRMTFTNVGGASVGAITLRLVGDPVPASGSGITVTKPVARYEFDPAGRETAVALIGAPAASFERAWRQNVRDRSRTEVVDNVARLDVRVIGENGATVAQTVRSQADGELVLIYEWSNAAGVLVSGSVTLTTTATPGTGYTLGPVRVTDNDPSSAVTRRR